MPVIILTDEQQAHFGHYTETPSPNQLARYFHLDDVDRAVIRTKRRDYNRLGFAIQLCTVRFLGTFLSNPLDVPEVCIDHIANQLGIKDTSRLHQYLRRGKTHSEHTDQIRAIYGYKTFGEMPEGFQFTRWLYTRAWLSAERPSVLFDLATAWLLEHKVLLPGPSILERSVAAIRERAEQRLWSLLASLVDSFQVNSLLSLLKKIEGQRNTSLDNLRRPPVRVSGPGLVEALERLEVIRSLGVGIIDLSTIPNSRVKALAQYALVSKAQAIEDLQPDRKIATLLAFAHVLEANAQDDALDLFDLLVNKVFKDAVKSGEEQRLRTLRDLDLAARNLKVACEILLDPTYPDTIVRQIIFQQIPPETLSEAIQQVTSLTRPPNNHYYERLAVRYRSLRRYLPKLLTTIEFQGLPISQPVRDAAAFLQALDAPGKPSTRVNEAPGEIITSKWRSLVIEGRGRINLIFYTFCFLHQLQDGLSRHDIFVTPSQRWNDPRSKMLHGKVWQEIRSPVCRVLGLTSDPYYELERLSRQLDIAYHRTANNLANNPSVRIEPEGGHDRLVVTGLDDLPAPESLVRLDKYVSRSLPLVELPQIMLEIHARTGFANAFFHISEMQARADDLPISLCAVLMAEACNIPLEPLVHPDVPALTRDRLLWVQQNYIRAETLIQANARLVDVQASIPLARAWGGGEVASADGLRFTVPVRTLHAEANAQYFGAGRGVTFVNFTSDQFSGFHGIVIPGAAREALYILDGLLEQQSSLIPTELMTDTAGYTDVIFGLFWLLGYQYSPRLADIGKARFWRINRNTDYGALNNIARHRAKTGLISDNWDDLLRVAGSLKFGTLSASELMRTLRSSSKSSVLTKAIQQLGRISKTLYLLSYIDDATYRRRILTQLNRGESRHALARAIFFGKRGELHQPYHSGMENQLGALGLVTNIVVLWNTLYMNAALENRQRMNLEIHPEDQARLSPLHHRHINFLGHYDFSLPEPLSHGQLRPLRDPF